MVAFAGNPSSAPIGGFLLCNGAKVSRTTYANLFSAIGTIYGTGDGSTTFTLPNMTDKFIQGSGTSGTSKSAGLPNITGTLVLSSWGWVSGSVGTGAFNSITDSGKENAYYDKGSTDAAKVSFSASASNSIYGASTTVQPPSITMRYYVKY